MKLRYLRARNVLSFGDDGDKDIKLEFGPFNVIAGPNDSGKTNLFRALSLIEKAFDYGKPPLDEILFRGDSDRSLHLEVGVELDDTELELLATLIICSEMLSVLQPQDITQGIKENKHWKSILINYGYPILTKSLRRLSFVLCKDELRISEPKIVIQVSDGTGLLYIDRQSHLSETSQELGSYQRVSLAKEMIEDFTSRFGNPSELDVNSLIQDIQKLSDESSTLITLLKGKLGGSPHKIVELHGAEFNQYLNTLRAEPILTKLSQLCERRGIGLERLYIWQVLEQFYKTSFVRLQELRFFPSTLAYSGSSQDSKGATIPGSDLAMKLFWLKCSGTRKNREKYSRVQAEFKSLTGSEFDVAVREKEVDVVSEGELGVLAPTRGESVYSSGSEFTPLGTRKEIKKRSVNEAFVQVIKDNYPVTIEQTASGLYEILFLLTTIIGESGKILLLDEPELHLHPTMQKRILNLLSEPVTRGRNQMLLITHSPYFISAEDVNTTWRFTMTEHSTKAHNLGRVLSELESQEQEKLAVKLSNPDVRSLLFSRGVIFVEGLSDKIVVEQIDRYLSTKKKGANIDESEWPVIDIGGKESLQSFMTLSRMLGVPNLVILDYDALMRRDHTIRLNGREVKTSTIIFTLWRTDKLENWLSHKDLLSELPDSEWYENSHLKNFRTLALKHCIFVFSTDLEGVMQSPKTDKMRKPLKALERVLDLINQDNISSEFYEMCEFLRRYTSP
jgi:energy-coupling factor transporter ATP-binding protein EcfA2